MTTTQIEAAAAEFRDWLDGFPLTKTSKDLIAAKAAEIFGRKHADGSGVTVEGDELRQAVELVEESIYQRFLNTRSFSYLTTDELKALRIVLDAQHADQPTK
jgi:hypothetical protein